MIIDAIGNASLYYRLGRRIEAGLRFLETRDFSKMQPGRYDIEGDACYALVQDYETKPRPPQAGWEAHRKYVDIQYVVSGIERIGYANLEDMRVSAAYDESKDALFLEGKGDFLLVRAGTFLIFGPQDAHMPGLAEVDPSPVRKVVVKVEMADG